MNSNDDIAATRLSRIVLIKSESVLVLNDRWRIKFLHTNAFRLAWTVCQAMAHKTEFQALGGIPPDELVKLCNLEGLELNKNALITLWHDEVEFRRHTETAFSLFEFIDLKKESTPTSIRPEFIANRLQLIFCKVRPPTSSGLHRNVRLFTVQAEPEQILTFLTWDEARAQGIEPSGISEITKFRKESGKIGFLDWEHKVQVNDSGSSDSIVYVQIVNMSPVPLRQHLLPIWSDIDTQARSRKLKAWTKNQSELPIEILIGANGKKKKAEFLVTFPEAIPFAKPFEFWYSYHTHLAYKPGKEYFTWYFQHPQARYLLDLQFSDLWILQNPIVFFDKKDEDIFQVEQISERHIRWIRFFPKVAKHYDIHFLLSRADK